MFSSFFFARLTCFLLFLVLVVTRTASSGQIASLKMHNFFLFIFYIMETGYPVKCRIADRPNTESEIPLDGNSEHVAHT